MKIYVIGYNQIWKYSKAIVLWVWHPETLTLKIGSGTLNQMTQMVMSSVSVLFVRLFNDMLLWLVTSTRIWTTIPTSYNKSDTKVQKLCDVHFLFVCKDTYACLSLKFERKKEVSIGELQLVRQQSEEAGPLSNIMDKTLDKEQNIQEIKEEANEEAEPSATNEPPETESVQHEDQLGLVPFLLCQN